MPKYSVIFSNHVVVPDVEANKKEDAVGKAQKLYNLNPKDYDLAATRQVSVKRQRGSIILPNES